MSARKSLKALAKEQAKRNSHGFGEMKKRKRRKSSDDNNGGTTSSSANGSGSNFSFLNPKGDRRGESIGSNPGRSGLAQRS